MPYLWYHVKRKVRNFMPKVVTLLPEEYPHPMLTSSEFVVLLRSQRASQAAIGRALGVSQIAVSRWLSGARRPSKTVLLLAEALWINRPVDLPAGLPAPASERVSCPR